MNKKGRVGAAAGSLIGLITILIIFYIILIPSAERDQLFAESEQKAIGINENILLSEQIGRLVGTAKEKNDHLIPNMLLKETSESILITQENPFIIKQGITAQYKTIHFTLENPEQTDNAVISFNLPQHTGTLQLILNNNTIFEGELKTTSPTPVKINKNLLKTQNTLQLEVHGFGVPAKVYAFENFKIIGDLINAQKQEASHLISIPEEEYLNVETAYLEYIPICSQNNIGTLEVYVNSRTVFTGVPDCNSAARIELYQEDLNLGRNEVKFRQLKGTNNIEQARLKTTMNSKTGWSNTFYVTEDLNNKLKQGRKAILNMEFANDGYTKIAETNINNKPDRIEQSSPYFSRDITSVINLGKNYIAIKPEQNLNINKIEIIIQ